MFIEGFVKTGTRTKELVKYLLQEDIAVIQHDDIDMLAAEALIDSKPKAVINTGSSMTGRCLSKGTEMLIKSNVILFDTSLGIDSFKDKDSVRIKGKDLILNNNSLFSNSCLRINHDYIKQKTLECSSCYNNILSAFIDNTLQYAEEEKEYILNFKAYPELSTGIKGRTVIVVLRSSESKAALTDLKDYIEAVKPVLVGVDGGADTIISCGLVPDILIGDMDSVSDVGIYRSKELVLHAYTDGRCPCLSRIAPLGIKYKLLPAPGTSEDATLLLIYDKGASNIILLGGHSSMTDFLERGRRGMGSSLITRIKVSDRLIDYKNINKLQALTEDINKLQNLKTEGELLWMKM